MVSQRQPWLNPRMRTPMTTLLISLTATLFASPLMVGHATAGEPETVTFETLHRDKAMLRGFLLKPDGDGPFPTIALFHGCSGPAQSTGTIAARERARLNRFVGH